MMSVQLDNCSITGEIKKYEKAVQECYERIDSLENKLREITDTDKQSATTQELKEIRKLLTTHEHNLSTLRGQNRKSFAVAVFIMLLTFTLYMFYILIIGRDV